MTLEQVRLISGIVGAAGIIASLVYLAIQVRQNARSVRMSTGHAVTESLNAFFRYAADKDNAELIFTGFSRIAELEDADRMRFYAIMHDHLSRFQSAYFQMALGMLEPRYWTSAVSSLRHAATFPGVQTYWRDRAFYYAPEFQQFLSAKVFPEEDRLPFNLTGRDDASLDGDQGARPGQFSGC